MRGLLTKIKTAFAPKGDVNDFYQKIKLKAKEQAKSDDLKALSQVELAARLGWLANTSHKHDKDLDDVLRVVGASNAQSNNADPDGEIVIVTSGILEFGGLTQQVVNLVQYLPEHQKVSLWTTQAFTNSNLDCDRAHFIEERCPINAVNPEVNVLENAAKLAEWSKDRKIKAFIYFLSPDDTLGFILPSVLVGHLHALINVSHHVFCLGSNQFDMVVDVSDFYYKESVNESRNKNLEIIYLSGRAQLEELMAIEKNDTREHFGIPEEAFLTATVGNPSKNIWDKEESYLHIIGLMLERDPNIHHLLIAKGMKRIKDMIVERYPKVGDRLHVINGTNELIATLKCCDLYLNSYPMGGALSSLDAIAAGLAMVAIPAQKDWFKIAEITALNQEEYLNIIAMFVIDDDFRREQVLALQDFYKQNHQPEAVAVRYMEVINSLERTKQDQLPRHELQLSEIKRHIDAGTWNRKIAQPAQKLGWENDKDFKGLNRKFNP